MKKLILFLLFQMILISCATDMVDPQQKIQQSEQSLIDLSKSKGTDKFRTSTVNLTLTEFFNQSPYQTFHFFDDVNGILVPQSITFGAGAPSSLIFFAGFFSCRNQTSYAGTVSGDGKTLDLDNAIGSYVNDYANASPSEREGLIPTKLYLTVYGYNGSSSIATIVMNNNVPVQTSVAGTSASTNNLTFPIGPPVYNISKSSSALTGTSVAAYYSTNGGSTWNTFNSTISLSAGTVVKFKGIYTLGSPQLKTYQLTTPADNQSNNSNGTQYFISESITVNGAFTVTYRITRYYL
ncbi:hypothetical protein BH09BAC3_BH09BAC3_35550 [soil metagenome]